MNTRNLRMRRKGYAAVVYVPSYLQEKAAKHFGSRGKRLKEIVRGLDTRDLKEANKRKLSVISQIESELARLDRGNYMERAREISKKLPAPIRNIEDAVDAEADKVYDKFGGAEAKKFRLTALGKLTPTSLVLEQWLGEAFGVKPSTLNRYKTAVEDFIEWSDDVPVQRVDRKLAGDYVTHVKTTVSGKTGKPYAPKTQTFKVNTMSQLWRWCAQRGIIDPESISPWRGQASAAPGQRKRKAQSIKKLRAITKIEAQQWLAAVDQPRYKHRQAMHDLIILVWHTGSRANDICELVSEHINVDDDHIYWLTIVGGKTDSNDRVLPIVSPEAKAVIERRLTETVDGELFPELERAGEDNKKYHNLQKTINRIRKQTFGNAPFDMHSFRRKFSTACEDAGLDPVQWSRMMGQSAPTLAAAIYNRGHKGRKRLLSGIKDIHEELGELT